MEVVGATVANAFVPDTVLLIGERGGQEFGLWTREVREGSRANPKLEIAQVKNVGVRFGQITQVFTWAQKKEKADDKASRGGGCHRCSFALRK